MARVVLATGEKGFPVSHPGHGHESRVEYGHARHREDDGYGHAAKCVCPQLEQEHCQT